MSLGRFRGWYSTCVAVFRRSSYFDIDANGILNVTAKDKASGKEQKVTITASTNLNKSDIDKMVQEARQNEAQDRKRRELIDARNTADNLVYQTEKALRDLGDKVSGSNAQDIQSKINDLKQAAQGEDVNQIKQASEKVEQAFHALSQQLYAQGQPQNGGSSQTVRRSLRTRGRCYRG
jgi:molecular chaperone DnaK